MGRGHDTNMWFKNVWIEPLPPDHGWKLTSLQAFVSDRSPILLECDCSNKWIWLGQFHFENFLLSHLNIFQIVQSAWNETVGQGAKDRLAFCASQL